MRHGWLGVLLLFGVAWGQDDPADKTDPPADREKVPAEQQEKKVPEVTITTSPVKGIESHEAPYSVSGTRDEDIRNRTMPRTAGKTLLEGNPGVHVQQTGPGQGAPFLRGLDPYRSLVIIDGIRFNHAAMRSGPNQYFGTIDTYLIGREEVTLGPSSVLWGSAALGGTIYIHTREPYTFEPGAHVHSRSLYRFASAEDTHTVRQEFYGNLDDLGWSVGGTLQDIGEIDGGKHVGRMTGTEYDEYAGDLKLAYRASGASKVIFAVQRHKISDRPRWHSTYHNDDAWQGTATGSDLRRSQWQERDLYYVQYHWTPDDAFIDALKTSLSWHHHGETKKRRRRAADGRTKTENFDLDNPGFWIQAGKDTDWGYFTAGVDAYHERVTSDSREFDPTPSAPKTAFEEYDRGIIAGDATYQTLGFFLQDEVSFGDLDVTAGVRFTSIDVEADDVDPAVVDENPATVDDPLIPNSIDERYSSVTGGLRFLYHVDEHWNALAGWGMGFRAPTLHDSTAIDFVLSGGSVQVPSDDLDPEIVNTFDLGAKAEYDDLTVSGVVFYSTLEDFLAKVDIGGGNSQVQNFGDGWVWGYELLARYRVTDTWSVFGDFGFAFGRVDYPKPTADTSPLPKSGPRRGHLGVRYQPEASETWVEGVVTVADNQHHLDQGTDEGGDPQRQPTPNGTPGYTIFTLRGGTAINENARVSVAVENITNRDYRIHGSGQNEPGTNFILGLDVTF